MIDLSIVIVNYNVRYYLEQCLRAVRSASRNIRVEIFVVDNHSTDESVDYLQSRFPEVIFIANEENLGFSRANNQAIRKASGRYVLLLNPDTMVTEQTLSQCLNFMDKNEEVGAAGTAMYGCDGRFAWESRRGVPTPWTSFCKMIGLTALFPHSRLFGRYYMRFLDRTKPAYIEIVSGAFMLLRRKALDEVGLLDENFFMYGEDIDLSYRMLQGGWKNVYLPEPILHYKGESTQKSSYRYVHIFYEAMLIFFDKHFRRRYRVIALLIRLAVYLRAAIDLLMQQWHTLLSRLSYIRHNDKPIPERAICIGSRSSILQMQDICKRNGLDGTFVSGTAETLPDGHLSLQIPSIDSYLYVVYDLSSYSRSQVVQLLVEGAGRRTRLSLGTYDPETHVMILLNDVYC